MLPLLATLFSSLAVLVPAQRVRSAVATAFAEGELVDEDYLWSDTRRGIDQFTDCLVLQSALYRSSDPLRSALGASIFEWRQDARNCQLLHQEIVQPGSGPFMAYYRYWHGNKSLDLLLLATGLSIHGLRSLWHVCSYVAVAAFAVFAWRRSRPAGQALGVIALFGACFSAIPYMGQLLSHAPGYLFVWLAAAWLVAREPGWSSDRLVLAAFTVGFVGTFIDMLASMPFLALMPLVAVGLALQAEGQDQATGRGIRAGMAAALGIVWATLSKQLLAAALFGWHEAVGAFTSQLMFRVGASGPGVSALGALELLLSKSHYLSFGRNDLVTPLLVLALSGWLLAALLTRRRLFSLLTLAANGGLLAWYVIFKNHTANHPEFMVRFLFLACAWGWAVTAGALPLRPWRPAVAIAGPA
ncbi:MAG: hypothetical protein RL685_3759 [Pseudomonadota bacterium]